MFIADSDIANFLVLKFLGHHFTKLQFSCTSIKLALASLFKLDSKHTKPTEATNFSNIADNN